MIFCRALVNTYLVAAGPRAAAAAAAVVLVMEGAQLVEGGAMWGEHGLCEVVSGSRVSRSRRG